MKRPHRHQAKRRLRQAQIVSRIYQLKAPMPISMSHRVISDILRPPMAKHLSRNDWRLAQVAFVNAATAKLEEIQGRLDAGLMEDSDA